MIILIATKIWLFTIQGSVQEDFKQTKVRISDLNTYTRESCHTLYAYLILAYITLLL